MNRALTVRALGLASWVACILPMPVTAGAPPAVTEAAVHVERTANGGFAVDLVMLARVPPALAWAVLTDFEHMASFVPNLTRSQVLSSQGNLLQISQKGIARYGPFSTEFESIRDIQLTPKREIRAHGSGGNVRQMESLMQVEAADEGTRLRYHAEVLPGFWFPPWVGTALVRHETAEQFSAVINEMQRRQAAQPLRTAP
ncbi:SRPBCC family protein [Zoogloea dura]|jgi:carbon monoxide dehydrogenase subunit G|nr:SRPBCC family protein [Zoogloea dura]